VSARIFVLIGVSCDFLAVVEIGGWACLATL